MNLAIRIFFMFFSASVLLWTACQSPRTSPSTNQGLVMEILQEAGASAERAIPRDSRIDTERFYFELAMAQMRAGDLRGACGTARKINNTAWLEPDVYRAVAQIYAHNGDFEKGLTILKMSTDACNWCTNHLLSALARGEFERGETSRALETARKISDPWPRHQTLLCIAERMTDFEQRRQAKVCIDQVITEAFQNKNTYEASIMLGQAGRVLATIGESTAACLCFSNAVEKTQDIRGEYAKRNRAIALGIIATNQATVGLFNDAYKTLAVARKDAPETAIGNTEQATHVLAIIAAEKKDFAQAMIAVRQISHFKQYQDDALERLAQIQANAHRFRDALASAELIEVLSRRGATKLAIAAAYGRDGDKKAAVALAKAVTLIPSQETFFITLEPFDFFHPKTWGLLYEAKPDFTSGSHQQTLEEAGTLAASATELNAVLNTIPQSLVLKNVSQFPREVAVAVARAQGRTASVKHTQQWARDLPNAEVRPWLLVALANGLMDIRDSPKVKQ